MGDRATDRAGGWREAAAVLRRRRLTILATVVAVFVVVLVATLTSPATYESSAQVLLTRQNLGYAITGTPQPDVSADDADRLTRTEVSLAANPTVISAGLRRAGRGAEDAGVFLRRAAVTLEPNTDILVFTTRERSPAAAERTANGWARAYTEWRSSLETAPVRQALAGLGTEITAENARDPRSQLRADLVAKQQQLETLEALQTSTARLVRVASPASQVSPRPGRNALVGLIAALCLGLLLALVREALDNRVRDADEVAERLRLPVLSRLAEPGHLLDDGPGLVIARQPSTPFVESLRFLRTRVELALEERGDDSLLVTSPLAGEGKTTTAANLALGLARTGRCVILLDMDLRRPAIHRVFGLSGRAGVLECLHGRVSLDDALQDVDLGLGRDLTPANARLSVLPAGVVPTDPSEVFRMAAFSELMREVRQRADLVVVDSPPLLGVGDTISLSAHVQAALVIIDAAHMTRRTLDALAGAVQALRSPVLGLVTTGEPGWERYGYGSGGSSGAQRANGSVGRVGGDPAPREVA